MLKAFLCHQEIRQNGYFHTSIHHYVGWHSQYGKSGRGKKGGMCNIRNKIKLKNQRRPRLNAVRTMLIN